MTKDYAMIAAAFAEYDPWACDMTPGSVEFLWLALRDSISAELANRDPEFNAHRFNEATRSRYRLPGGPARLSPRAEAMKGMAARGDEEAREWLVRFEEEWAATPETTL